MKTILPFLIVILCLVSNVKAQEEVTLPPTVVDVALGDENFSSLVAALTREDLTVDFVTALSGEGPFTVFAPTNEAFATLLNELGLGSLADVPVATLEAVLQMHVIPAKVMSTNLSEGLMAATLFGEDLKFSLEGGAKIMDPNYRVSNITAVDVEAENGVVHVIDRVILPDLRPESVVDIVTGDENFSILEEALTRDDLGFDFIGMLNGTDPVSVFAPTNDAFVALLAELGAGSLDDIDAATLEEVLKLHIIAGEVMSSDISNFYKVKTILGESLMFNTDDGAKILDPAGRMSNISVVDLVAMNGVVHGIDAVLLSEGPPEETVVDIIVESDDHNTLEAAVVAAGLVETLQGDGPFTVFAPTDAAFAALPEGTLEALLADPSGQLTDILLYHVVLGKAMSGDLADGQMIETAFGQYVTVTITPEGVFINGAQVTVADVQASNGVVHVIDAVLVPTTKTVVDIVVESENHTTLEAAVIAAGLVETLQGEGPFTVFAPTDSAFAALPEGTLEDLLADPSGELTNILLYHVVLGKAMSGDLTDGQMIETALGKDVTVSITSEGVFINDAQVTVADVQASNGVVHVIDAVLVPEKTVVDIVVESENHTILEAAVVAAGLVETLQGEGPFTVFAPTDSAFAALPEGTLEALLADPSGVLTDILLYHVANGKTMSGDLMDGQMIETAFGQYLTVKITSEGVYINDAMVTVADVVASNGVVHVIDAVLVPTTKTVVDVVVESEDHNMLEAAVVAAGLVETLQGEGPFTLFAPTDSAFAALPEGTLEALLADPSGLLTDILLYHVVGAKAFSSDLSDGQMIETIFGQNIKVMITSEGVYINDAMVTIANIEATNGVVHVIDAVLVPTTKTVVDVVVESEDHNTLEAAVVAAGLVETLQGEGPFTVFAPTDSAFAALPEGTLEALLADPSGLLTDILLYHVVGAKAFSSDLSDGQMIETVLGQNIKVMITAEGVYINDAMVTVADIEATNGVVHVIDAVLVPTTKTVVDIVVESENHTTLEAAVIAAGLVETLQGEGPFTVFAPTDAAFAALPEGTLEALLADPSGQLTDILLYHVVAAKAFSSDLSDGQMIETILGQDIKVMITSEGVYINDAMVTVADIEATNGVVHVIDAVLVPMTKTVVDVIVESEDHTTLEAAVIAAGLVETLQGDGPFTVFAPTDAAFAALPDGTLEALLEDPSGQLTDILLYHVVNGKAMSGDLSDGQKIETAFGQYLTVSITSEGVYINGAQVTVADIRASNGVVHVIDAVLVPTTKTVVDIIVESENHTSLEAAVIAAGLVEALQGEGPFTVFAPTDDAFADLLTELGLESLEDIPAETLEAVLLMHVVSAKVMSGDLSEGLMAETLYGEMVKFSLENGVMVMDMNGRKSNVTGADLEAVNGVVHVIDKVILPDMRPETVVDIATGNEDFSILVEALTREDLGFDFIGLLSGGGPVSVFAPTNDAFIALLAELGAGSLDDIDAQTLEQVLKLHIVAGDVMSSDISNFYLAKTVLGEKLSFNTDAGAKILDPAGRMSNISMVDLLAKNGVVHAIDAVLLPELLPEEKTVVDIIVESEDHTLLEAAVVAAGLVETLQGDGPFTVFAPTDAAFAALPEGTLEALLADPSGQLTDILLYHVVNAKAMSGDLSDGQMIETVLGQNIKVMITSEGVYINDAMVTVADIEASNGVVHVIDAVLLPSTKTVVDIVVESENHTTLEAAVVAAGLVETLQGDGPFTVFAPTDSAFAALPEGTLEALLADPSGQLTDILLYHVVNGKAMSGDLSDGQMIQTALGEDITVSITSEGVFINDAMVTVADIEASNGVVHVIDAVLLPMEKSAVFGAVNPSDAVTSADDFYSADIRIYPNPTSDFINIRSTSRNFEVSIMNLTGKVIYNRVVSSETEQIDVRSYVPGMYLVNVREGQNVATTRIIVQ